MKNLKLKLTLALWGAFIVLGGAGLAGGVCLVLSILVYGSVFTPCLLGGAILSTICSGLSLLCSVSLFKGALVKFDEARKPLLVLEEDAGC